MKKQPVRVKNEMEKQADSNLNLWMDFIVNTPRLRHWTEDFVLKCTCGLAIPLTRMSSVVCCPDKKCGKEYLISGFGEIEIQELKKTKARLVKKTGSSSVR